MQAMTVLKQKYPFLLQCRIQFSIRFIGSFISSRTIKHLGIHPLPAGILFLPPLLHTVTCPQDETDTQDKRLTDNVPYPASKKQEYPCYHKSREIHRIGRKGKDKQRQNCTADAIVPTLRSYP